MKLLEEQNSNELIESLGLMTTEGTEDETTSASTTEL